MGMNRQKLVCTCEWCSEWYEGVYSRYLSPGMARYRLTGVNSKLQCPQRLRISKVTK